MGGSAKAEVKLSLNVIFFVMFTKSVTMGREVYGHMAPAVSPKRRQAGARSDEQSPTSAERRQRPTSSPRNQVKLVDELRRANEQLKQLLREKYPDEADQKYLGLA